MPDRPLAPESARALPLMALPLAAALFASVLFGCLPPPRERVTEAPVVVTEEISPETAYWRNRYRQNRMEPPEHFSVPPRPMPSNQFGEFSDELYRGLDSQPELPLLPGENRNAVFQAGGNIALPMAPPAVPPPAMAGRTPRMGGTVTTPGDGLAAEGQVRLQPIEQLVYGGAYGEREKPGEYRLMPGDMITLTVLDHSEFAGSLTIQPDGTVHLPNTADVIRLRGLTVDDAAEKIRIALAVYIRGDAVVRLQTNRAKGGYYIVHGDVLQPGRFPMGMEPVKLSDAVLAANWEINPARTADDEEMGPAFPAASPRGRFAAPGTADLARVMLITPHRTQPARTVHDIRSAMLGVTGNDPVVRPGQIVVVPSLDPERNRMLGLTEGLMPMPSEAARVGAGFSGANTAARLPDILPPAHPVLAEAYGEAMPSVEANLAAAFANQSTTGPFVMENGPGYCETAWSDAQHSCGAENGECFVEMDGEGEVQGTSVRRLGRKSPQKRQFDGNGWSKGL